MVPLCQPASFAGANVAEVTEAVLLDGAEVSVVASRDGEGNFKPLHVTTAEEVPLRTIVEAGVPVALGADDPLLFGSRLAAQYETAREVLGFDDAEKPKHEDYLDYM